LTVGRHNTVLLDAINKSDPMNASYAFSPLGFSGLTAGMGDTEDARLDDSVKYNFKYDMFRFAALYQFGKTDSSPGEAWQGNIGFDYAGFSVDGVWGKKKDAIALGSLSAAQLALPGVPHDSLAATISDNESWTIAGSYTNGPWKASAGYEHIKYENPSLPITAPFTGLGGYYVSIVNNTGFPRAKDFAVSWVGLKYNVTKDFDITGAWYYYDQSAFGAVKCSTAAAGNCSGSEDFYSVRFDYRLTKRFDVYAGAMFTKVSDGLANGYLHTSNVNTMAGFRFNF
jgi:predicted porin